MIGAHCPRHGARVLLPERRIRAVHNADGAIVLEVECYDGERIFVVTGRGIVDGGHEGLRVAAAVVRSLVTGRGA